MSVWVLLVALCGLVSHTTPVSAATDGGASCTDMLPNCDSYGIASCKKPYEKWAKENCKKRCDLCKAEPTKFPVSDDCKDSIPNCDDYPMSGPQSSCLGDFRPWAMKNCKRTCGLCGNGGFGGSSGSGGSSSGGQGSGSPSGGQSGGSPSGGQSGGSSSSGGSSGSGGGCVYKGKQYNERTTWEDGCDYRCSCKNGQTGFYECKDRCAKYGKTPAACTMVKDSNDPCCRVPKCNFGGGGTPGGSPSGGSSSGGTSGTGSQGCMYKGQVYAAQQKWQDGCQYNCQCTDGKKGIYTCTQRCQQYDKMPASCTMQPDPQDSCCKKPVCAGGCVYKKVTHPHGGKWEDGCDYKCTCTDGKTGLYNCTERCPKYSDLPNKYCKLVQDPNDPCCKKPQCNFSSVGS